MLHVSLTNNRMPDRRVCWIASEKKVGPVGRWLFAANVRIRSYNPAGADMACPFGRKVFWDACVGLSVFC